MQNERQKILNIAGQLFCAGLSQSEGITADELHSRLVEAIGGNGVVTAVGIRGVREKLEEMRISGTVQKTDSNTYVYAPPGENKIF
jgi:hypothetical protein